jgi:hypothetical protein
VNDIAKEAVAAALQFEARLRGVSKKQDKSGPWCQVIFEVRQDELNNVPELWQSPLGSRWQIAAVELDDDETPLKRPPVKESRRFHEMSYSQQAWIRCGKPAFRVFLTETFPDTVNGGDGYEVLDEDRGQEWTANALRTILQIKSRTELDDPDRETLRKMWERLNGQFIAWRAAP